MSSIGSLLKRFIPPYIIVQKLSLKNSILLTFDDGPDPNVTPRILDILDKHQAKGLFFVPGSRIHKAPELLNEVLERKHGLGNHSYTHTSCSELNYAGIVKEINRCRDEIRSVTGYTTKLYRPPMGIITPSLLVAARRCQHKIIRWSFDSGEYSYMRNKNSFELAENFICNGLQERAILLSHDDNESIPEFLEMILPEMHARGFELESGLNSLLTA